MRRSNRDNQKRVTFLLYTYIIVIGIFLIRLFSIQVLQHGHYQALAQEQYWDLSVLPAKRGDIFSADNFSLAGTQIYYLLYAEPKKISNKYELSHRLAEIFTEFDIQEGLFVSEDPNSVDFENEKKAIFQKYYDNIYERIDQDLYWVVVRRSVSPLQKEFIENEKIKGIGFEEEPIRYYPEKTLASHVLGFVAFNEKGEKQGYFGIEGELNEDLKGRSGRTLEERDALGNPILIGGYRKSEPISGRDIVLTLNRSVQYIVEKKLAEGVEEYDARSGSVIVMDPYSGEIIAMANYPSYNPSNFNFEEDYVEGTTRKTQERQNLSISQTYEPGSVMKPFTVAAAVELGKVTSESTFTDSGPVQYSDYVINNWDYKHHGVQTVTQLLEKSNNIGASWVGHLIGSKDLAHYLESFGFGRKTGLELEGEDTGVIRDYRTWTDIDLATAAFGQGLSATPLQVLNGFNVFANGGFLLQPKIISKVVTPEKTIELPTRQVNRVISKRTADSMTEMLESATSSGEAKFFVLKNYDIAGKTGTAQIPFEGKYDPKRTNATFVGYISKSKKFSMIVKLEEPHTSTFASETAVPLWMSIASELVNYYGIAPDRLSD